MKLPAKWLIVDLDDTLIKTNLFLEVLLRCLLTRPHLLLYELYLNGFSIPGIKAFLAKEMALDVTKLPYRNVVIEKIKNARKMGGKIMLVTAAAEDHANAVSEHLEFFDHVISSSMDLNLKGDDKLREAQLVLNGESYDYIGCSISDIALCEAANKSYLINPSRKFENKCQQQELNYDVVDNSKKGIWEYDSKILRPYQWMKNIVFFFPAVTSIGLYDYNNLWLVLPAFSIMSTLASVVYIFNDIADLESDRAHPKKKSRGFASGEISLRFGFLVGLILSFLAITVLMVWQPTTMKYFLIYFFLTIAYTMVLKEIAILDIIILVSFYLLRILIGIEVLGAYYSIWFITFCVFLFANLAFLKRFIEVNNTENGINSRRNYDYRDREFLRTCGISSIFASVVLLMLYSKSSDFSNFYNNKDLFTLISIPYSLLMLKMWYLASRNKVDSDPLVFVIKNPFSYIAVIVSCFIIYAAR